MTQELENTLVEKYPKFFEYLKDYKGPLIPISFGFECDDGWHHILSNLMESIDSYIKNNSKRKRIKNKYFRYLYDILGKWSNKLSYKYSKHLLKLRKTIDKKVEWEDYESIPPVQITQIKEKFGTLRFYYNGGDDIIGGMVWLAEHMSGSTCEICGSTKYVYQTKGWIKTTCEVCTPIKL